MRFAEDGRHGGGAQAMGNGQWRQRAAHSSSTRCSMQHSPAAADFVTPLLCVQDQNLLGKDRDWRVELNGRTLQDGDSLLPAHLLEIRPRKVAKDPNMSMPIFVKTLTGQLTQQPYACSSVHAGLFAHSMLHACARPFSFDGQAKLCRWMRLQVNRSRRSSRRFKCVRHA